jgi:hypothetical protein
MSDILILNIDDLWRSWKDGQTFQFDGHLRTFGDRSFKAGGVAVAAAPGIHAIRRVCHVGSQWPNN